MDILSWIKKHPWISALVALIFVIIVPFGIDKVFTTPSILPFFSVCYHPEDILSFYGIVLGSITTIIALIETIQHTEKMHSLDYERQLTPLLASNIYNHSQTSKVPIRVLYVNTRPVRYYQEVSIRDSIDRRDMQDTFFDCQIDYLVQNVSHTSAIDITILLNGKLLHGPFSLVPGGEESIGIRFFDERKLMRDAYPQECKFVINLIYTNANRSKEFNQCETIAIKYQFGAGEDVPPMTPNYGERKGLSHPTVEEEEKK